eukprot:297029-Hanusia_phi.AAC.1
MVAAEPPAPSRDTRSQSSDPRDTARRRCPRAQRQIEPGLLLPALTEIRRACIRPTRTQPESLRSSRSRRPAACPRSLERTSRRRSFALLQASCSGTIGRSDPCRPKSRVLPAARE